MKPKTRYTTPQDRKQLDLLHERYAHREMQAEALRLMIRAMQAFKTRNDEGFYHLAFEALIQLDECREQAEKVLQARIAVLDNWPGLDTRMAGLMFAGGPA